MHYLITFILLITISMSKTAYANKTSELMKDDRMTSTPTCEILGLGAACVDLLIPVTDSFLKKVPGQKGGSQPIDFETLTELVQSGGIEPRMIAGGSCANTIKTLANLNVKSALFGTIGQDPLGKSFSDSIQRMGVIPLLKYSTYPTARVICLITPDGQRTMRFFSGSSQDMTEKLLDIKPDLFKGVKIVHIEGYLLRNGNLVKKTMQLAQEAGVKVSIDLASFEVVKEHSNLILELLTDYVDIVFANRDEVYALTGLPPYESCLKLQEICPVCVILMGKDGCLVGSNGILLESPAFAAQVVDTTGAGDLFASGFLYGYLKGESLEKCARRGNYLGASATEITGTEFDQEKWTAIRRFFDKDL